MKKWKKVLLAAVLLLAVGGYAAFVKISYYPMGGKVTTVDKYQSGDKYYIVVEEATGTEFTLLCPESEYDKVMLEMRCIVSAIRVLSHIKVKCTE